jgi:hypothetical protein
MEVCILKIRCVIFKYVWCPLGEYDLREIKPKKINRIYFINFPVTFPEAAGPIH